MKEPFALTKTVDFGSCVPVETLRARALIGLHMMAAGGASLSNSALSCDLGDMWRYGC